MPYGSASLRPSRPAPAAPPPSPWAAGVWDGTVATHPLYDIALDAEGGLILARTRGFWTVREVDEYFTILADLALDARARYGRVKIIADVTQAPVQGVEVAERFAVGNRMFREPGDKVALIASSSLQKMQIRRSLEADCCQVFVSETAARLWINAYP